ncbi:MAG: Holliday junction resolvase RuvX [Pseudomonadales bacterium]|nr:Holliday junction resolvase RuvX [Pseudomonadales bacterium]
MGFDFGTSKIGVAVGQHVTGTATAVGIVRSRDGIPDWSQLDKLVSEWEPDIFVVGLPLNMDGSESEMSARALKFARRLEGRYHKPAKTMDERLTTREASAYAEDGEPVDDIAARLILESWLRESPRQT